MIDVVVNHLVYPSNPPTFSDFNPFNTESDFHSECFISDYNNQTDVEQCWLGDSSLPLADTNTEDDTNVSSLNSWIKNLVSTYSADGIRIDTVKHIRQDFWPDFASSAGVYTIGEVRRLLCYIANKADSSIGRFYTPTSPISPTTHKSLTVFSITLPGILSYLASSRRPEISPLSRPTTPHSPARSRTAGSNQGTLLSLLAFCQLI